MARGRGDSTEKTETDEDEAEYSEEEDAEEQMEDHDPSRWMAASSTYVYLNPEHLHPQT